jgi:transposase
MKEPQEIEDEEYEQILERVCAIDVAKASGKVCTRVPHPSRPGARRTRVWDVDATTNAVLELGGYLAGEGIEKVTLESTGVIRGNEDQRRCCRRSGPDVRVGDGKGKSGIDERPQRDELCCRLSAWRRLPR